MRAMPAISVSVIFGLLSTAAVTIRLGSRIRIARSSRVPFIATRDALGDAQAGDALQRGLLALLRRRRRLVGSPASTQREVASPLGAAAGVMPRAAK